MGWKTRRRASDGRGRNLQEVSEFEYFDYTGFVKVAQRPDAFYGKLYRDRKAYETAKNEAGHYAEQAAATLKNKRIGTGTEAYKTYAQGKLPPALLHARAKRYTVKMFLAHLHEVWRSHEGLAVPLPYSLAHLDHAHSIDVPVIKGAPA